MSIGQFIDAALRAFGTLFTAGTVIISLAMVTILAIMIKKRNHLTRQRMISNIAGYVISATLFMLAALFAIPLNTTSIQWIVFVTSATLLVCLAILIAKFWDRYEGGPLPLFRGQIAGGILWLACFIAPRDWAEKEQRRIDSVRRSLDTIQQVVNEKRLQGILPERS